MVAGANVAGPEARTAVGYDGRVYRHCINRISFNDDVRLVNYDGSPHDNGFLYHGPMNNPRFNAPVFALVGMRLALVGSSSILV